jgi:hypothetical protein
LKIDIRVPEGCRDGEYCIATNLTVEHCIVYNLPTPPPSLAAAGE